MRTVLICIVFLISTNVSSSQISLGFKTGLNLCQAKYLDDIDEQLVKPFRKLKPGLLTGIVIKDQLNEVLSVQAEVLYSQKGLKFEQLPYNKTVNSMNYIEIPISGQYNLHRTKTLSFEAYIGGYAAYWINGKYKYEDLTAAEINTVKVDFNDPEYTYNRIDAGVFLGIVYKLNRTAFFLRYTHSMTGSSQVNADALTNRLFSVGLNINFIE